jgi:hypothetical protein
MTPQEREQLEDVFNRLAERWPEKVTNMFGGSFYVSATKEEFDIDDPTKATYFLPLVAEALGGVIWYAPCQLRDARYRWQGYWECDEGKSGLATRTIYPSQLSALIAAFCGWAEHRLRQE